MKTDLWAELPEIISNHCGILGISIFGSEAEADGVRAPANW